jgi:hypothetical protein
MAMITTSRRCRLYLRLDTTTAGRFLVPDWSVKGNGTSTTSPKLNLEELGTAHIRS